MLLWNNDRCLKCGGCVAVCQSSALMLYETYLKIDQEKCIACGACVKICPMTALKLEKKEKTKSKVAKK